MEGGVIMKGIVVYEWPKRIWLNDRTIFNPSPEQCKEAGYRLYTSEELQDHEDALEAQRLLLEKAEQTRMAEVLTLRTRYREITRQICEALDIEPMDKFESFAEIQQLGSSVSDPVVLMQVMQLALALLACDTDLKRKDGNDAWDRI